MAGSVDTLEIPEMVGIGDARYRTAQADGWRPPARTTVISAASHWLEGDNGVERFPPELKARASSSRTAVGRSRSAASG